MNSAQHISQAMKFQKRVWFVGAASTKYSRGTGLCYNRDYGTAADSEGRRDKYVEVPSTTNNLRFAGVLDATVTLPSTGARWVTINEPGSVCEIAIGSDTVVDTTLLTCLAGPGSPGRFRADTGACLGRGSALALQTNASGNTGESVDGTAVVSTATVTKTGMFAGAAAGDKVVVLASSTAAGAAGATQAIYTISSVTSDDEAVLTASPGDGDLACYVMGAVAPTCLALLHDGEESGLIEWIEMADNAASVSMVAGVTHILGGVTLGAGDCLHTLADGTFTGEKKGFVLHGALTTQDYLITVTSGIQHDGVTALATMEMDGATDYAFLEWYHANWQLVSQLGTALA